jgi:hypothetical protein
VLFQKAIKKPSGLNGAERGALREFLNPPCAPGNAPRSEIQALTKKESCISNPER